MTDIPAGTVHPAFDKACAAKIAEACSGTDYEANGSKLDVVIAGMLTALGMTETLAAFDRVLRY